MEKIFNELKTKNICGISEVKLISTFCLLSIIFLIFATAASATSYVASPEGRAIRVTLINQEPNPVDTGQYVKLRFRVENIGTDTAKNVVFEIMPKFPFSLDPGADAKKEIGTLEGVQTGNEAAELEYRLRVDKTAVSGSNEIVLRYNIDSGNWIQLPAFNVSIRRYFPGLSIESVSLQPEYIAPGSQANLSIQIKNLADSFMKDISVSINLSSSATPFIPIGSGTERKTYQIMPGEEKTFAFTLLASPDAALGIYKIPLLIIYKDDANNNYSKSDIIGVIVDSEPVISVNIYNTALYTSGTKGKVTFKIVNSGSGNANFLTMKIKESKDYKVLSDSEEYVGELSSDDYDTIDFTMFIEKTDKDYMIIPVTLDFSDTIGNHYEKDYEVKMPLYSSYELKKYGLSKGNSSIGIVIMLFIIVAGILIYRQRRKIKHGKSAKHD